MTLNQDLVDLAVGANRVLTYGGYVLLAGTLTFWSGVPTVRGIAVLCCSQRPEPQP